MTPRYRRRLCNLGRRLGIWRIIFRTPFWWGRQNAACSQTFENLGRLFAELFYFCHCRTVQNGLLKLDEEIVFQVVSDQRILVRWKKIFVNSICRLQNTQG